MPTAGQGEQDRKDTFTAKRFPWPALQAFMATIRGVDAIKARLVEFQALTATCTGRSAPGANGRKST